MKRAPIRRKNSARAAKRLERDFGPLAEFVRTYRCCVCHSPDTQACHVKSRGAGGHAFLDNGDGNLIPMCHEHHRRQHDHGWSALSNARREWKEGKEWAQQLAADIGREFKWTR